MITPQKLFPRARRLSTHMPPMLPRLPVPPLRQTLDQYLQSIKPFLLDDEARGGPSFASSFDLRVKWAQVYEKGLGKACQERLLALDKASPNNWLDDNIWMKKTYLEWRAPLLIHSNWWLAFCNDDGVPEDVLRLGAREHEAGITPWQVRRAAWLVHRILEFKDQLDRQELHPDATRTAIWLRETTEKMFNVCRIPKPHHDLLASAVPSSSNSSKLLVMLHDWCYAIDVYNEMRDLLPVSEIERRLRQVVRDAGNRIRNKEIAVPVGLLSSDGRDRWAQNFRHLLGLSPRNRNTFRTIQESLFTLSLDNHIRPYPSLDILPAVNTPQEVDAHLHNVRSSNNARNRWFDKCFTLIVEPSSRAGAMGEHSPCDALVPSIVCEYAVVQGVDWDSEPLLSFQDDHAAAPDGWERLDWTTDEAIERECVKAEGLAKAIVDDSDDSVLWFRDYGGDWIKSIAKFSPDAYLQMVLQLAWYRTQGYFTATYETALTRMFAKGRTETIRTLTAESRAWVLGMMDPTTPFSTCRALLSHAIHAHTSLTRKAATGRGIDRHLLGLQLMQGEGERCELFEDDVFKKSQRWALSTSGLSAGHLFRGTGFGALFNDGYGVNYLAGPDIIKFSIESKKSAPNTCTGGFKQAIAEALRDMKTVCDSLDHEDGQISSRL